MPGDDQRQSDLYCYASPEQAFPPATRAGLAQAGGQEGGISLSHLSSYPLNRGRGFGGAPRPSFPMQRCNRLNLGRSTGWEKNSRQSGSS